MTHYIVIALLLMMLAKYSVDGSELREFQKKVRSKREETSRKIEFFYKRWDKEDVTENEIDESKIQSIHKPTQDYACGRAVADKKYKDIFMGGDQNLKLSMSRNKYRPTEIRMPRVIGGDETSPGEFPWTVSVKLNGQPICGGSLIDKSWILTAAHCVVGYNPKNLTIRLGAYRIKDTSETQTIDLPVAMFIVHKEYSMPRPFSNDIALLKLNEPVEYTDFIIPICLPKDDSTTVLASPIINLATNIDQSKWSDEQSKEDGDSGGIVISTKMSDKDIAKCFTKLEQNYLSSIGLGPEVSSTTTPSAINEPSSTATTKSNRLFSYGDLLGPLIIGNDQDNLDSTINFSQKHKQPIETQPPFATIDTSSLDNIGQSNNFIYYGPMWNHKNEDRLSRGFQRRETVKLSRLPISKELLREIQSVGSGPMQALGLQPVDFVAMASDLTSTVSPPTIFVSSAGDKDKEKVTSTVHRRPPLRSTFIEESDDPSKYSGLSGIVVGWGWVRELDGDDQVNKGYPSVTLQKVKLPILRNNVCEAWFQSQAKKITLLPSQFCAGFSSGGKDACRGDSGGPMIIEDNSDTGRYTLIGIVSAGIGCARPSLPGLYTRVASFLPWIKAQLVRY